MSEKNRRNVNNNHGSNFLGVKLCTKYELILMNMKNTDFFGKGHSATGFSPIYRYMEDTSEEKCSRLSKVVFR